MKKTLVIHYKNENSKSNVLCGISSKKRDLKKTSDENKVTCAMCKKTLKNKHLHTQLNLNKNIFKLKIPLHADNAMLRRLLLSYKYRNLSIEEAVNFILDNYKISDNYISDEVLIENVIPAIVRNVLDKDDIAKWYDFKHRKREVINLQFILMFLMKEKNFGGKRSSSSIGKIVRNKDHATVLHAIKSTYDLLDTDEVFKHTFNRVLILIKNIK